MGSELLKIENLRTYFYTGRGLAKAVDGVSLSLKEGDTLGIVGESGCGKSVTALSVMRLVASPPGKIVSGRIIFEGRNLLKLSDAEMRKIRGNKISMIFQEPMTSLNPVFEVGEQISEVYRLHQGCSRRQALNRSIEALRSVGIPSPEKRVFEYPHQLSGGMRQRVMIAMAIACRSRLMIADEPTTALDVTIQAQILDLMERLKQEIGMSIILITHNMGLIAETVENVIVMYAGKIMEQGAVLDIFEKPHHPYTSSLLESIPRLDNLKDKKRLHVIRGTVPSLLSVPAGCKFSNRCQKTIPECFKEEPPLFEVSSGHVCRCWLHKTHTVSSP